MRFDDIALLNPPIPIKKGAPTPFLDMAALPTHGRDVRIVNERPFTGSGARFQNGDTLIARITPCLENGKGAQVRGLPDGSAGFGSTEFIVVRGKDEQDADFIYYLSRHEGFRAEAIKRMEGTSGRQRVAWQQIASIEVPDVSPEKRREIAAILGALDDKIELNRKASATLEEMARALYRSWFVDFDPVWARLEGRQPAHMDAATAALFPDSFNEDGLPVGWLGGILSDLIEFNPKERLQKGTPAPYFDMKSLPTSGMTVDAPILREFASGTKFRAMDTLLARITPCLENGKSAMIDDLGGYDVAWGSTEFIVMRARSSVPASLPYCVARDRAFREEAIATMTGSSGRQRADSDRISSLPAAIPNAAVLKAFGSITMPMISRILELGRESRTLATLRDTLLPRLMSGELRVGEARELVEEVA